MSFCGHGSERALSFCSRLLVTINRPVGLSVNNLTIIIVNFFCNIEYPLVFFFKLHVWKKLNLPSSLSLMTREPPALSNTKLILICWHLFHACCYEQNLNWFFFHKIYFKCLIAHCMKRLIFWRISVLSSRRKTPTDCIICLTYYMAYSPDQGWFISTIWCFGVKYMVTNKQ